VDNFASGVQEKLDQVWEQIGLVIRQEVNVDTYNRWFASIRLEKASESELQLRVPNKIFQFWIESNYMPVMQAAFLSVLGATRDLKFVFDGEGQLPAQSTLATALSANGQVATRKTTEVKIDSPQSAAVEANALGMNPRNTFDTFVVGSNNQFAHAASIAVAQSPAKTYNPLFIYGGTGLGKTHLMHAIGQAALLKKRSMRVVYLSTEQFTNEFIDAIQNNTLTKFRKKYRQADLLLIDDIQFLAGKERSQEEFFHTFNTLFDGHKQIVLSSDRPASEISSLEQRLVSRFEWGLTAELQPPDVETRLAILRKKAQALGVTIDSAVLDYLAERIRTNVRRLEGALMRVASYASLNGCSVGVDDAEHLLRDILQEEARKSVTIDQIQRRVAEIFDVRLADMTSKRRPAHIAFPRQIAMYLSRKLTKASLNEIGDAFGGRDHGTVIHAARLVRKKMEADESLRQRINHLDQQLQR